MRDLAKWQVISFISRILAMLIGMVQTFVIVRLLTVEDWGLTQLAFSIGGALGIYQHLGLASASTREISSAKKKEDIFQIFVTSTVIRYCVTIPLAIGLFVMSEKIAVDFYKNSALILPLKIYAVTLVFQGLQSILNSVISGTKRFKALFLYQVIIAFVSILIHIPLIIIFGVTGFFYAFLVFNVISSLTLTVIAFKPLKGYLKMPTKNDFKRLFKEIFSISMAIYAVKIIYTNWEKIGNNVLGLSLSTEIIAMYAFALLYAKKLMNISDSVTAVNLPVLSEEYSNDHKSYKDLFTKNFNKVFSIIIISGAFASYWAPTIIRFLVGGDKYNDSLPYVPQLIFAFVMYSFINIVNSSVLIPAKLTKSMIFSYVYLLIGTITFYFISIYLYASADRLNLMSWAMVFGGFLALINMVRISKKKIDLVFLNIDHYAIIFQSFSVAWLCTVDNALIKAIFFPIFVVLIIWSILLADFLKKNDFLFVFDKIKKLRIKKG